MCLITKQKRVGVLGKDMKVYKVVRKYGETYCSPIQSFEWEWDTLYETDMGIKRNVPYPSLFFGEKYSFVDKAAAEGYSGFMRRLTVCIWHVSRRVWAICDVVCLVRLNSNKL